MDNANNEPYPLELHITSREDDPALATCLEDSFFETRRLRKDGWDGRKMAEFVRTLSETGIVTFACRAADMSAQSAYALRHRNPVFARAWDAALAMARHRLADELLARSLKGSQEALLRDGAIVAERQHFDNKLAFSVLRRLDRQAELGSTFRTRPAWDTPVPAPAIQGQWQEMLDALTEDRIDDAALLLTESEVDSEVDNPRHSDSLDDEDDDTPYVPKRVWQIWQTDEWRTDFPPPTGFDGDEKGNWEDSEGYSRSLTADEMAALVAGGLAEPEAQRAEINFDDDAAERDRFFAALSGQAQREECEAIVEQRVETAKAGRPARSDRTDVTE